MNPSKVTHKQLCQATAKVSSYIRVGNQEKAKEWSRTLVSYLVLLEVYPPHRSNITLNKGAPK